MGEKGEGSGGDGEGNWECGTPLSTPSNLAITKVLNSVSTIQRNLLIAAISLRSLLILYLCVVN